MLHSYLELTLKFEFLSCFGTDLGLFTATEFCAEGARSLEEEAKDELDPAILGVDLPACMVDDNYK